MSGILRGTTPDFVIKVNTEDFLVTDVTKLEVTIWNGTKQTIYGLSVFHNDRHWRRNDRIENGHIRCLLDWCPH